MLDCCVTAEKWQQKLLEKALLSALPGSKQVLHCVHQVVNEHVACKCWFVCQGKGSWVVSYTLYPMG